MMVPYVYMFSALGLSLVSYYIYCRLIVYVYRCGFYFAYCWLDVRKESFKPLCFLQCVRCRKIFCFAGAECNFFAWNCSMQWALRRPCILLLLESGGPEQMHSQRLHTLLVDPCYRFVRIEYHDLSSLSSIALCV